jgi:hypothetical protein
MLLKLMSNDGWPDADTRKRFMLVDKVAAVRFERETVSLKKPNQRIRHRIAVAHASFDDGSTETFALQGNAYVLSDDGKIVSAFGMA